MVMFAYRFRPSEGHQKTPVEQLIPHFLIAAFEAKRQVVSFLVIPKFLSQDIMPAGSLQKNPVLIARHPPVQDPNATPQLPAQKTCLDSLHRRHVLSVARKNPTPHRQSLLGHG
jgi:hypothetical protein